MTATPNHALQRTAPRVTELGVVRRRYPRPVNDSQQTNRDCERCAALRQRFNIRSPADLSQAIRVARDGIAH